jgi:glycosyltransferase involved in cell wall biosynthesis
VKLAVLTTRLFDRPTCGGESASARLLETLEAGGHQVTCIGRGTVPLTAVRSTRFASVAPVIRPFADLSKPRQLAHIGMALARNRASTLLRIAADGAPRRAMENLAAVAGARFDAVVVDHLLSYAWIANASWPVPPIVLVMHNVEAEGYAERAQRLAGRGPASAARRWVYQREARLLRRFEDQALRQAAAIACLSEDDATRLQELARACGSRARVEVLASFPRATVRFERPQDPAAAGPRIGLMGSWTWGPNAAALIWMFEQVVPHLPAGCSLVLAGTGLDQFELPPGARSLGRVEDVAEFYSQVDVVAIPSVYGSGVQEKAIEAIGTGLPVVATSHAVRGLQPGLPGSVSVTDEPQAFARLCAGGFDAADAATTGKAWSERRQKCYFEALERCLQAALHS